MNNLLFNYFEFQHKKKKQKKKNVHIFVAINYTLIVSVFI